jgi:HD-like signal output (HDOD) protein
MNDSTRDMFPGHGLMDAIGTLEELPTLPQMAHHLRATVHRNGCGLREIKRAILLDPPTAALILREASRQSPGAIIRSIDDAVMHLSVDLLAVLCERQPQLTTFDAWNEIGVDSSYLWKHALETGILAKALHLRKRMHHVPGPDPYLTGLLHHIGWHVLDVLRPDLLRKAIADYQRDLHWSLERERMIFGMDHAEIGARLLENWGIDESIVRAIRYHHKPDRAGPYSGLAGLVQMASSLTDTPFLLNEPLTELPDTVPNRVRSRSGPLLLPELRERYGRYITQATSGSRMMLNWL